VEEKMPLHLIIGENIIARNIIEKPEKPPRKIASFLLSSG
jgi:hypothetical protein